MQDRKSCPLFVDFVRECTKEIVCLPQDTFDYCTTEKFTNCPFYLLIYKKVTGCEYMRKCPVYAQFKSGDFDKLIEITKQYCLFDKFLYCKRYALEKAGMKVPVELLPDGSTLNGSTS
ncbi:MAG: hypothetical protein PHI86_03005 [Candidatus Omnitrophica bacterium]|nr:hypothetical protein [Candidatus Omnitrophota bacterium]